MRRSRRSGDCQTRDMASISRDGDSPPPGVQSEWLGVLWRPADALPCIGNGAFHGIKRAAVAGQHRVFSTPCKTLAAGAIRRGPCRGYRLHTTVGVRPCGCLSACRSCPHKTVVAPSISSGDATREHVLSCQPPGAWPRKDGEYDRQFLRQDRHGQRKPGQQSPQRLPGGGPVGDGPVRSPAPARQGNPFDNALGLTLHRRGFTIQGAAGTGRYALMHCRAGGYDDPAGSTLSHQRTRVDLCGVAQRLRCARAGNIHHGEFVHRNRFAGQQRFVHHQIGCGQQFQVGWYTVASGPEQPHPHKPVHARQTHQLPVAHNQRAWTGQVPQGIQRAFDCAAAGQN